MFVKIPVRPSIKEVVDTFVPILNIPLAFILDTFVIDKLFIFKLVVAVDINEFAGSVVQVGGIPVPPLVNT